MDNWCLHIPKAKAYRSIKEILDIFNITILTADSIIKKYKIDSFANNWKIQVNAKDFYKAYITHYNPSLFEIWNKKKTVALKKIDNADIFKKLFGSPNKKTNKKNIVAPALIGAKYHEIH
jgi:hypothetical protein